MKKELRSKFNFFAAVSRFCLYLFVAFLPFQIDSLVLSSEVFYSGFYNPYLSHFVYLSDIFLLSSFLFFGLALAFSINFRINIRGWGVGNRKVFFGILGFIGVQCISLFWTVNFLNSFFYVLRSFEFFGLYLLIVNNFIDIRRLFYIFIGVISFEALVGIFQYILQESLGLRFFGEPVVSSSELGVAKVTFFDTSLLRVYGTFSHPNLFAGYLVFAILMIFHLFDENRALHTLLLFVCVLALFLTFSRSAMLALVLALLLYLLRHRNEIMRRIFVLLSIFLIIAFLFGDLASFAERIVYMNISLDMLGEKIFGVGAGNFTAVMQNFSNVKLLPWLFQPVHNIYLLIANELGIIGFISIVWLFSVLFFEIRLKKLQILMPLLVVVVTIGFFDHYFLTLYQGQALFWLTIGLGSR